MPTDLLQLPVRPVTVLRLLAAFAIGLVTAWLLAFVGLGAAAEYGTARHEGTGMGVTWVAVCLGALAWILGVGAVHLWRGRAPFGTATLVGGLALVLAATGFGYKAAEWAGAHHAVPHAVRPVAGR